MPIPIPLAIFGHRKISSDPIHTVFSLELCPNYQTDISVGTTSHFQMWQNTATGDFKTMEIIFFFGSRLFGGGSKNEKAALRFRSAAFRWVRPL